MYRVSENRAIIVTTDFFPPVVDDPYWFGAIAAANAMSDIWAMGGEMLLALNIAAFPSQLDRSILSEIMRGGAEKVREAGAVIAGGHTVKDDEPKYGLVAIGIADIDRIRPKGGAQPGDVLILTKPLGAGVVTTALKQGKAAEADVQAAMRSMARINKAASAAADRAGAHGVTDITGYGLLGHAHEMADQGGVDFKLSYEAFAWLPGARRYADDWIFPGGMADNRSHYRQWVTFDEGLSEVEQCLLFDPETSGGLLIAVPEAAADALSEALSATGDVPQRIGVVTAGSGRIHVRR